MSLEDAQLTLDRNFPAKVMQQQREAYILFDPQANVSLVEQETTDDTRHAYDMLLLFLTEAAANQYKSEQIVVIAGDPITRAVPRKMRVTLELL